MAVTLLARAADRVAAPYERLAVQLFNIKDARLGVRRHPQVVKALQWVLLTLNMLFLH